jgi:hypothetical protein
VRANVAQRHGLQVFELANAHFLFVLLK